MFTSIVKVENNRIAQAQEFEDFQSAQRHCDVYGGFVYEGKWTPDLFVQDKNVTIVPITPTQEQINNEAKAYLASTDWYVVRFAETGVAIPQEILEARQKARESIT